MTPEQQRALDEYLKATQSYANYTPEQLRAAQMGETGLANVQYDPRMREYEMSALRALEEQGREGLTAQDKAAMAQMERETGQAARGRRGAIQQSMQGRGISGSGLDLVAQLQSAESANELAAMRALEQGGMAAQRRTQGQLQAGQMAGQMGQRQYQQEAERAAAQDRIRQFNAQNQMGAQQFNIGMGAQTAANRMQAQQGAAQMQYNAAAEAERARLMREEERRRKRQGGVAAGLGALGAAGGAYFGGPAGAGAGYQIGSGLAGAFAEGGRVPGRPVVPGDSYANDTQVIAASPGEIVLPRTVSDNPDAAAAYVDAYTRAEQGVEKAKGMRDILGYADIAAKGISDYAQSQAPTTFLPRRMEELGRGPEAFQRQMPQYQQGSLAALGEQGVQQAQAGLGAAKEKFGMDVGLEKYKTSKEYDDPTSQISQRANLLLRSQIKALQQKALATGDKQGAQELMKYAQGPDVSANQAMQTLNMVKSVGDEYGDMLKYLNQKQKLDYESRQAGEKGGKALAEGKPVSGELGAKLSGYEAAKDIIQKISKNWDEKAGAYGSGLLSVIPGVSNDPKLYKQSLAPFVQQLGGFLEGGKLTDEDFSRYAAMMPAPGDTAAQKENKIQSLMQAVKAKQNAELSGLESLGYRVPATSSATPNNIEKFDNIDDI